MTNSNSRSAVDIKPFGGPLAAPLRDEGAVLLRRVVRRLDHLAELEHARVQRALSLRAERSRRRATWLLLNETEVGFAFCIHRAPEWIELEQREWVPRPTTALSCWTAHCRIALELLHSVSVDRREFLQHSDIFIFTGLVPPGVATSRGLCTEDRLLQRFQPRILPQREPVERPVAELLYVSMTP
jgi:hypothetical protein